MSEPRDRDELAGLGEAYRRTPHAGGEARRALLARLAGERPPRRGGLDAWLPRTPWLRPLALAGAAALLVLVGYGLSFVPREDARPAADGAPREIEFVLVEGRATRVAVVGDFNDWDATRTPMRRVDVAGTWTASVPLGEGTHAYAFVVDGRRWVNDPTAPLAPADDFGATHSVLVVPRSGS